MIAAPKTKTPATVIVQAEPTAVSPTVALEKMLSKLTGEQRTIIARIQTGATLHRDPRPGYLRENGINYNEWPVTQPGQPCRSVRVVAIEPMIAAELLTSTDTLIWTINPTIVAALARSTEASTRAPVDGEVRHDDGERRRGADRGAGSGQSDHQRWTHRRGQNRQDRQAAQQRGQGPQNR